MSNRTAWTSAFLGIATLVVALLALRADYGNIRTPGLEGRLDPVFRPLGR